MWVLTLPHTHMPPVIHPLCWGTSPPYWFPNTPYFLAYEVCPSYCDNWACFIAPQLGGQWDTGWSFHTLFSSSQGQARPASPPNGWCIAGCQVKDELLLTAVANRSCWSQLLTVYSSKPIVTLPSVYMWPHLLVTKGTRHWCHSCYTGAICMGNNTRAVTNGYSFSTKVKIPRLVDVGQIFFLMNQPKTKCQRGNGNINIFLDAFSLKEGYYSMKLTHKGQHTPLLLLSVWCWHPPERLFTRPQITGAKWYWLWPQNGHLLLTSCSWHVSVSGRFSKHWFKATALFTMYTDDQSICLSESRQIILAHDASICQTFMNSLTGKYNIPGTKYRI